MRSETPMVLGDTPDPRVAVFQNCSLEPMSKVGGHPLRLWVCTAPGRKADSDAGRSGGDGGNRKCVCACVCVCMHV